MSVFGGKGGDKNLSKSTIDPSIVQGALNNQTALVGVAQDMAGIAKEQQSKADQVFNLTTPGLTEAEQFYQSLASGDPAAIARATAPTAQAASEAGSGAKRNILATAPAGGERNLALEEVDVAKQKAITGAATGATQGAENALATIGGAGISESTGLTGSGISAEGTGAGAISAGTSGLLGLGGLQMESQKIKAEQKGNEMGAASSVASAAIMAAMGV